MTRYEKKLMKPTVTLLGNLPAHWLSLFLFVLYLVSYAGVLHSVDELSGLTVTETLLIEGKWHTNAMAWDQNRTPPQNALGIDGNLYSKKGVGVSLVALPLFALGRALPTVGAVQFALLTNAFLTAITVYLFYQVTITLAFKPTTAVLGALALGLATPLWPYTRTLFSESLAALGLCLALLGTLRYRVALRTREPIRPLVTLSCGLAILVLARSANAILAAPILIYLVYIRGQQRPQVRLLPCYRALLAFALPFGGALLLTVVYNYVRFHTWLTFPLEPFERFSAPLATGLIGLLLSPGKGLFWYMPVIILIFFGVRDWRPSSRVAEYLLAAALSVITILFYAKWYDWTGGRAWGPRMIVITAPALITLCLPMLDRLRQPAGMARWWIGSCLLLSILVQIPGVLINFEILEAEQMKSGLTFDQLVWSVPHTPLLTAWPYLFKGTQVDPIWWRADFWQQPTMASTIFILLGLLLLLTLAWGIYRALQAKSTDGWWWLGLSLAMLFTLVTVQLAAIDPRWHERTADPADSRAVVTYLRPQVQAGDVVLLDMSTATDQYGWQASWMNRGVRAVPYLTWVRDSEHRAQPAQREDWIAPYARVWLVMQAVAENAPEATTERWLDQYAYRGRQQWIGSQRIVEYVLPPTSEPLLIETVSVEFDEAVTLENYAVYLGRLPHFAVVDLAWGSNPTESWRFSIQALDAAGKVVAQLDDNPADLPGRRDRVGLALPTDVQRLILKVYDSQNGQVAMAEEAGQTTEFFTLATLRIP